MCVCLDPPVILNKRRKVAVQEREEVKTECIVDGNPRAEIIWLGPNGQRLSAFKTDRILNHTIISSRLHCKRNSRFVFVEIRFVFRL